jgi:hypothetical protein
MTASSFALTSAGTLFSFGLLFGAWKYACMARSENAQAPVYVITYFAIAVLTYAVHGALRDTDNQLRRPHRLGTKTIGNRLMRAFMISLITAEVGAFLVIFSGYLAA